MGPSRPKGHYGIDAPYAPALMIAGAIACLAIVVFARINQFWVSAAIFLSLAAIYLHTTLRGKFLAWRNILDGYDWHGNERVLDLGCGRGAVLLMAAGYVPAGRAVGIDIWSNKDQSGNAMAVTLRNAEREGVADREGLHNADMRQLPFEDGSFDVIVSSVAIHNIGAREGRDKAINEAWRVLRPGGRLLVADISKGRQYVQQLDRIGATPTCRSLGWRMWWGAPLMGTTLIEATKPASS